MNFRGKRGGESDLHFLGTQAQVQVQTDSDSDSGRDRDRDRLHTKWVNTTTEELLFSGYVCQLITTYLDPRTYFDEG
jgi:hypothetical protein